MKKLTLGLLAHVDAGKTTLSEALLYRAGEIRRLGRVDHGDAYLDQNPVERNRGITVFSKQALLTSGNTEITLLDTPGHVDFSAEMERVLSVIDMGLLILSAPDGIQSHTETLWRLLRQRGIPVMIFINKMDLAIRSRETIIEELTDAFGEGFVDMNRDPDSEEFIDDLTLAVPELAEKVLSDQPVTDSDIAEGIRHRQLFPCLFGSALRLEGIEDLLSCLDRYTEEPAYAETFGARVFKVSHDDRGERLTFLKVTGGSLSVRMNIDGKDESGSTWQEKIHQIRIYSGMKYRTADSVDAGTVCAVTGLTQVLPGDALGSARPDDGELLEPYMTYTVRLPEGLDIHRALKDFQELGEEDPKLHISWTPETGEIRIRLMGEVQMEILHSLISERYGYEVEFCAGRPVYLETISDTVEGIGHFEPLRHYAEVHLILEPGERGSGLVFTTRVPEDRLARNWQRLILGGLEQSELVGVLIGAPLTDVKITLASGRAHEKHTSGGDFREASGRAVRQGLMKARSVLLEPWLSFQIDLPTANVGRVMTDIRQMGGRIGMLKQEGDFSRIPGEAPAVCLLDYPLTLAGYTSGQGRMLSRMKGYDVCHNTEEVRAQYSYDPERDTDHPADSVFVSHGAGNIVHWDEVEEQMHLPSALRTRAAEDSPEDHAERAKRFRETLASDDELRAIFERTYGTAAARKRESHSPAERIRREKERTREALRRNEEIRQKHARSRDAGKQERELLIIDGYNLINYSEPLRTLANADLGAARDQLIDRLINYQGYTQCELIVVFDAYKVPYGVGATEKHFGVTVQYTREDESADIRIGKMADEYGRTRRLRIISSDALIQQNALGHNAMRTSSREFIEEMRDVDEEIRTMIREL